MYRNRLRDLREDKDLKQKNIAEYLQIHQTTYSDYELGELNIPVPVLHKLADFYGVSIDYLLCRTNVKEPYPQARKKWVWIKMYERIRALREDNDLKQEDIARYLNCTQACYSNYENGKRDIPTEVLQALARYYNVSSDYLLGMTNVKKTYPKE